MQWNVQCHQFTTVSDTWCLRSSHVTSVGDKESEEFSQQILSLDNKLCTRSNSCLPLAKAPGQIWAVFHPSLLWRSRAHPFPSSITGVLTDVKFTNVSWRVSPFLLPNPDGTTPSLCKRGVWWPAGSDDWWKDKHTSHIHVWAGGSCVFPVEFSIT